MCATPPPPLRRFLQSLGIASDVARWEAVADGFAPSTLHVFVVHTSDEASGYLRRFAGVQCAQQLLVVGRSLFSDVIDVASGRALSAYAAVQMDDDFASNFFEVFAAKIAHLAHAAPTTDSATATARV